MLSMDLFIGFVAPGKQYSGVCLPLKGYIGKTSGGWRCTISSPLK